MVGFARMSAGFLECGAQRVIYQLTTNVAWGRVAYYSLLAYTMQVLELLKAVHGECLQVVGVLAGVCRTLAGQITCQQGITGRALGPYVSCKCNCM